QVPQFSTQIDIYRNVGTRRSPRFELFIPDLANLGAQATYSSHAIPGFGDLDGDGDLDMLIGKLDGTLDFYRNVSATPNSPFPNFTLVTANLGGIQAGTSIIPLIVELSGDSLPDLLIGNANGTLRYYENNSQGSSLSFQLKDNQFGGIDVSGGNPGTGFSIPTLFTRQGETFLLVGSDEGPIFQYSGLEQAIAGESATLLDGNYADIEVGTFTAPTLGDLNNDGVEDLIVGNQAGGINLFLGENDVVDTTVSIQEIAADERVQIFPNPSTGTVQIQWTSTEPASITIFDLQGRVLRRYERMISPITLKLDGFESGAYMLRVIQWEKKPVYHKLLLDR
ncbi:MAG: T9SS type A sorting domain-containing protein, partial [Bacteroidota bacterium]